MASPWESSQGVAVYRSGCLQNWIHFENQLKIKKCCMGWQSRLFPLNNFNISILLDWASQVALVVKNPSANAGDARATGSVPGLGRPPGEGNGTPLQYSCLENPMDRGAWWATVHGAPELDMAEHAHTHTSWSAQNAILKKSWPQGGSREGGVVARKPWAGVNHLL